MLHRDYIQDMIDQFCLEVSLPLKQGLTDADIENCEKIETAIGKMMEMDAKSALALAPASLVSIMQLTGVSDYLASYIVFGLMRLADMYEKMDNIGLSDIRRSQAGAIAETYGCDINEIPEEFLDI